MNSATWKISNLTRKTASLFTGIVWAQESPPHRFPGLQPTFQASPKTPPQPSPSSPWMHSPSVQFSDSWLRPSQCLPPFLGAGAAHSRTLRCSHSGLHTDHSLHTSQLPSTAWAGGKASQHCWGGPAATPVSPLSPITPCLIYFKTNFCKINNAFNEVLSSGFCVSLSALSSVPLSKLTPDPHPGP